VTELPPTVTTTEPAVVDVVKAKKVTVVPEPELAEKVPEPAEAVTGAATVARAETSLTPVADADTTVFAGTVTTTLSASAASTELSAGTGISTGSAAVAAAVTDTVLIVNAAETDALAGAATRADVTSATAEAIAISGFFNEVIVLFSLFLY
jgi:hypothetical protein